MELLETVPRALAALVLVIVLARLNGLRSFSKMSGFDFILTVASGSVFAAAITNTGTKFYAALAGLVAIWIVQSLTSRLRSMAAPVEQAVDNTPLLLMENGEMLLHNMAKAQITRADLLSKLREANALDMSLVRAVVFETTGNVSVLYGSPDDPMDDALLSDVRR
ncbi:DUF421 domain-containing protein [Profundibacterium mesophilum]|uniref:YetF C-terminal domain-containing protein n=1 Tax=Profundibacterium mesophilum KAUST100406-0324 TaxID=1037889 RepID=A0A921TCR8_9RHOB|nr:YetF domain-containing protein [Profundibacterium mesophilum]KAF0676003.1 hypothetical protein PMES_01759 [Profundibacterium mesophilum KAUST100406-0324]